MRLNIISNVFKWFHLIEHYSMPFQMFSLHKIEHCHIPFQMFSYDFITDKSSVIHQFQKNIHDIKEPNVSKAANFPPWNPKNIPFYFSFLINLKLERLILTHLINQSTWLTKYLNPAMHRIIPRMNYILWWNFLLSLNMLGNVFLNFTFLSSLGA